MNWTDHGIIIDLKPFGERFHIATIFTRDHGRARGLVRISKKTIAAFENLEIKTAQQLEVKGGTSASVREIIGSDDIVIV